MLAHARPTMFYIPLVLDTGPAEAKLHCTYVSVYAEVWGVWGHAPPGKSFEFNAVRWLLRLFWGSKRHYYLVGILLSKLSVDFTSLRMSAA